MVDEVLRELQSIVGSEWASDEDWVTFTYRREVSILGAVRPRPPRYVVLPKDTDEVRRVLMVANKHKIPVHVASLGVGMDTKGAALVSEPNALFIDLRRMTRIEVDDKNLVAVVEPGVMSGELYRETRRRGLSFSCPSVSYTHGIVGNYLCGGFSPPLGPHAPYVLGCELVLPTGEVINTGSAAFGTDWFAPDPYITPMLASSASLFGVVTKLAIRLFPEVKEDEGETMWVGCSSIDQAHAVYWGTYKHWLTAQREIVRGMCAEWLDWVSRSKPMLLDLFKEEDSFPHTLSSLRKFGYDKGENRTPGYSGFHPFMWLFGFIGPEKLRKISRQTVEHIVGEAGGEIIAEEELHPEMRKFKDEIIYNRPRYFSHWRLYFGRGLRTRGAAFTSTWDKWPTLTKKGYEILERSDHIGTGFWSLSYSTRSYATASWYIPCGNLDTPEELNKVRKMIGEMYDTFLSGGGVPYYLSAGGLPTHIRASSPESSIIHRAGLYSTVLKRVKKAFDPNEIMSPGMF